MLVDVGWVACELVDHASAKFPSDHRRDPNAVACLRVEPIEPRADHRLDRERQVQRSGIVRRGFAVADHDGPVLRERMTDFFQEERIAARAFVQAMHETR